MERYGVDAEDKKEGEGGFPAIKVGFWFLVFGVGILGSL